MNTGELVNTGTMVNLSQPVSVVVTTTASSCPVSTNVTLTPTSQVSMHLHPTSVAVNINPFYLKPLAGNIRVCQGCRGSVRLFNGSIPAPPFDFVVARMEKRPFRTASGDLQTPAYASAAHYHARLTCIKAADPSFVPSALRVPNDVRVLLKQEHLDYLRDQFK